MKRREENGARIGPAEEPLDPEIQEAIDAVMRGNPPLVLFTTLARDRRLFLRYFGGGLLDRGNLTLRQREIVIHRTTALCGAEYEWGVHAARFGAAAGLTDAQLASTVSGGSQDPCWADDDRPLIELCDSLNDHATIDDGLWTRLRQAFTEEAILELLLLAGFYRTTSYLVNALQLPLEPQAARFAQYSERSAG